MVANSGIIYKTMSQIVKCMAEETKLMKERQESNDDDHLTEVAVANQPGEKIRSKTEMPVNGGTLGLMTRRDADGGQNAGRSKGNGIKRKQDSKNWQILVGNINTFPREHGGEGKAKLDAFNHLATSSDSDIILLSEHNTNVKIMHLRYRPSQVMWNWWQNVLCRFEYIKLLSSSGYEQGGTAIITHSRSTAHTKEAGGDNRQLGRWNWITVQEKETKRQPFSLFIGLEKNNKHRTENLRE